MFPSHDRAQWATRIVHEAQTSKVGCFLTLTINDENMVKNGFWYNHPRYGDIWMPPYSVYKRSLQLFFKRVRKHFVLNIDGKQVYQKFKYFACGEYGEKYSRPHYHACLLGIDFPDRKFYAFSNSGERLYRSESLEKLWPFGFSSIRS